MGGKSILRSFVTLVSLAYSATACATPGTSTYRYHDPVAGELIKNELVVKQPFSDTWDTLVGELAKSFFAINNVEKASRIINVSFGTDKPEAYVDYGVAERTFEYGEENSTYKYPIAGSSFYKFAEAWGSLNHLPAVSSVSRKTSLEGRINIYVAPKDNDTTVTVNARYVLTARVSRQREVMNGYGSVIQRQDVPEKQTSISFNTGQPGSADWGTPSFKANIKCRSTGLLESEILKMVAH